MQVEKFPSRAERLRQARPVPEFPGCRPITIPRDELAAHEGRFEFRDADTETAWVMRDPTGFAHEGPSQRLAGRSRLIAAVRGAPIEGYGTMDLILRDARGERPFVASSGVTPLPAPDAPGADGSAFRCGRTVRASSPATAVVSARVIRAAARGKERASAWPRALIFESERIRELHPPALRAEEARCRSSCRSGSNRCSQPARGEPADHGCRDDERGVGRGYDHVPSRRGVRRMGRFAAGRYRRRADPGPARAGTSLDQTWRTP